MRVNQHSSGQALVEFALVFPFFLLLLFSVIILGLYVFYNQQLENASREAARYAVVNSSTSQCPTVSHIDPPDSLKPRTYYRCDAPEAGWPYMTGAARSKIWGMAPNQVKINACWSGYVDPNHNPDALPTSPNTFTNCTMRDAASTPIDPRTDTASLPCPSSTTASLTTPPTDDGDDKSSDIAVAVGTTNPGTLYPTSVTVYSCFIWRPPLAGFIIIPDQITLRSVVTQVLQRQQ